MLVCGKPLIHMFVGKSGHSMVSHYPYPQTLDYALKTCKGQTLKLIMKSRKLCFITLTPVVNVIKLFSFITKDEA
jgi:hypothetical protein